MALAAVLTPTITYAQTVTATRGPTTLDTDACTVNTCLDLAVVGSTQQQLCLVTVLDASASMIEEETEDPPGVNRWDRTLAATSVIIEGIGDDPGAGANEFGLVVYASSVATPVSPVTNDTASFQTTLDTLSPPTAYGTLTWTEAGIQAATGYACPDDSYKVMLLGSDGVPTLFFVDAPPLYTGPLPCDVAPTSDNSCTSAAIAAADDAKAAGWDIITVGLGLDPGDPTEALGIATLDSISSGLSFNIPTPADASAVVDSLIDALEDIVVSNVAIADTLTNCWSYATGSTTGDLGTDDPFIGPDYISYFVNSLGSGDTPQVCFDMEYSVACGGNVESSVVFNSGQVTYDSGGGSGQTDAIESSAAVDMSACQSALPVELVEFAATTDGQTVTLGWSTASELNNAGFDIEHAFGSGTFEAVAFVEGNGSTSTAQEYSFTVDNLEPGTHTFRLKQIDFDGAFEYSEVLEAVVEVPDAYYLSEAYPNPFNPQASMRFWVTRSQHVEVALHDIQGRRLSTLYEGTPASKTSTLVRIDGSGLSSGTYLIRIQGEDFADSRQVTLLK